MTGKNNTPIVLRCKGTIFMPNSPQKIYKYGYFFSKFKRENSARKTSPNKKTDCPNPFRFRQPIEKTKIYSFIANQPFTFAMWAMSSSTLLE